MVGGHALPRRRGLARSVRRGAPWNSVSPKHRRQTRSAKRRAERRRALKEAAAAAAAAAAVPAEPAPSDAEATEPVEVLDRADEAVVAPPAQGTSAMEPIGDINRRRAWVLVPIVGLIIV